MSPPLGVMTDQGHRDRTGLPFRTSHIRDPFDTRDSRAKQHHEGQEEKQREETNKTTTALLHLSYAPPSKQPTKETS